MRCWRTLRNQRVTIVSVNVFSVDVSGKKKSEAEGKGLLVILSLLLPISAFALNHELQYWWRALRPPALHSRLRALWYIAQLIRVSLRICFLRKKEYAKHLATLLDHSNASIASVTAYAAASSPTSAHLILAVAGSLAAADDALRHYAVAVDRWRDYLRGLKALEDEVGNIMRDREILVTRLIKASKPIIHSNSSSSLPISPAQSQSSLTSTNAKLAAAQTELQACEAHLAAKEAALSTHRAALVSQGLAERCHALAECGQRWSEAGRAGVVSAQGGAGAGSSPSGYPQRMPSDPNKPLPVTGSDVSLAPSQSASQINLFSEPTQQQHIYSDATLPPPSLDSSSNHHMVPPAHAMTDRTIMHLPYAQRVLSHRITEESLLQTMDEDGEASSVADEDEPSGPLKVVENPRFAAGTKSGAKGTTKRDGTLKRESVLQRREPTGTAALGSSGSIRGLFGRRGGSDGGAKRRRGKGKGRDDDDDMSEPDVLSEPTPILPRARVVSDVGSRRRKGMHADGARKAEEWVGGQGLLLPQHSDVEDKGWASDGGITPTSTLKRRKSKGKGGTVRSAENTVRSVASSAASDSTPEVLVLSPRQKRRASLGVAVGNVSADALVPSSTPAGPQTTRAERHASLPVRPTPRPPAEAVSLMSIVEDVARANRDGWAVHNTVSAGTGGSASGSGGLVEAKTPRPDGSTVRGRTVSTSAAIDGLPRAPGSLFLPSASSYTTPAVPASFSGPEIPGSSATSSPASSVKRPAKSPLRSALRTPTAPPPVSLPSPVPVKAPPPLLVPVPIPVPAPILNGIGNAHGKGKGKAVEQPEKGDSDDAASISSYETGHETFEDGEETEHEEDHGKPPTPPPHEYGNGTVLHDSPIKSNNPLIEDYGYGGSDLSASSASTQTGAPAVPQRRKSVRVSLQPTFSTTPPAIDEADEDEEGGRHAPWSRPQPQDMWEDSSEEDIEYQKAKKLLTRISRKEKKNTNR
ncbi:hypothetical protein MSAN_02114700 [Mycena sanguinolenta]|uniref:Uncharacterized protein n=1 Tax=Mycena sanguinolenta TaxID=230812 RepID=A0A8H6XI05_9AGAR|nr:hypothetical protein MSAN_02114700 [Mycena sanguinolenta]